MRDQKLRYGIEVIFKLLRHQSALVLKEMKKKK